jgi:threonine dehydrogenase-like Zn-dependent dehydrogenase
MPETMKVVAVVDDSLIEVRTVKRPIAKPNQIVMKVHGCALCTFEQRIFKRIVKMPLPFIGGHEVFGEVFEIGSSVNPKTYPIGQKIAGRLLVACGECYYCRKGEENLCSNRNKLDTTQMEIQGMGGLSQYITLDARQIYKLDNDTPLEVGIFAEPLACVVNSIEIGRIELGDDVVVIGGGIMGQLHVMLAKLSGARVILSEPDQARRNHAEKLGCDITFNPMEVDPVEYVKSLTEGRGAEVVFNTTAVSAVAKQAVDMTAPLGRVVMYSSQHPDVPFGLSANHVHDTQIIVTGSVSPTVRSFTRAVNLLSKRIIDPTSLVFGVHHYTEAQKAFEEAVDPKTMRIIVTFEDK